MDDVIDLVWDFLKRRDDASPVLVLTGSRCCGKTTALESLVPRLGQRVPHCRPIDCVTVTTDTLGLLTALAFELNYRCAGYGRLAFPRLVTGSLVLDLQLDTKNPARARDQVSAALEEYRKISKLRDFLSGLASAAVKVLPTVRDTPGADDAARFGAGLLLDGLLAGRFGRKITLGPGQDWYGDQGRGLGRDPLDVLVDLNRRASRPVAGSNRRLVAELFWAAFLADLHASYEDHPHWDLNCMVLLDNADAPAGLQFLDELTQTREARRAARPRDKPDPLTVVATSRGVLPSRVLAADAETARMAEASYISYTRMCDDRKVEVGWYPVRLPDLTEPQTGNLVAALGLRAVTEERLAPVLYQFTAGHPGSTYQLLAALKGASDLADLTTVLGPPVTPEGEEPSTAERLLRSLTGGVSDRALRDLMTCAAARDQDDASRLAEHSGLMKAIRGAQRDVFADELWVTAGDDRVVMLPVLRRLLLRRLAADHTRWRETFEWLAEAAGGEAEQYYKLATGMVEHVARRLSARLATAGAVEWLSEIHAITEAPGVPCSHDVLVSWAGQEDMPVAAVGSLVAALWLLANSLSAHGRHELYTEASACLEDVARFAGGGRKVLRAEARKYARLAEAS